MIIPEIKIYEGDDLSGPVLDVMFLNGIAGSITEILLIVGGNVVGDAVFNITKNGIALFTGTDRMTVASGTNNISKTGLSINVAETDVLQLDLEECGADGVTAPITLILKVDDGASAGLSSEEIQDMIADFLVAGSNVNLAYNDAGNQLVISSTDTNTQLTSEQVQDIVGAFIHEGTGVTVAYDDAANTLTISSTGGGSGGMNYPEGGTTGQVLAKASDSDDDVEWQRQIETDFITGLELVWNSGYSITVKTGAAYIPSLSKVLRAASDITKSSLSLSASTFYYVYLYDNSGTPDIEISTTAPSVYFGNASVKTGDTSRRFIGTFLTSSISTVFNFVCGANGATADFHFISYDFAAPFRLLDNAGTSGGLSTLDVSPAVPSANILTRIFILPTVRLDAASDALVTITGIIDAAFVYPYLSAEFGARLQNPTGGTVYNQVSGTVRLKAVSRELKYRTEAFAGSAGLYIDMRGFSFRR